MWRKILQTLCQHRFQALHTRSYYDPDFGCTCPSSEMWYTCSLSPDPSPEDFEYGGNSNEI